MEELIKILQSQNSNKNDWEQLEIEVKEDSSFGLKIVNIPNLQIEFCFHLITGEFKGIVNYKQ